MLAHTYSNQWHPSHFLIFRITPHNYHSPVAHLYCSDASWLMHTTQWQEGVLDVPSCSQLISFTTWNKSFNVATSSQKNKSNNHAKYSSVKYGSPIALCNILCYALHANHQNSANSSNCIIKWEQKFTIYNLQMYPKVNDYKAPPCTECAKWPGSWHTSYYGHNLQVITTTHGDLDTNKLVCVKCL